MNDRVDQSRFLRLPCGREGIVDRAVVDDDDFQRLERLPMQGSNGLQKAGPAVEGRQDDADGDAALRLQDRGPPGLAQRHQREEGDRVARDVEHEDREGQQNPIRVAQQKQHVVQENGPAFVLICCR